MITVDKQMCTACGACVQKCPLDCISLTEDENGFLYPEVCEDRCVDCGACDTACPINITRESPIIQKAYAVVSMDPENLVRATSGGAFGAIAEVVLSKGGVVYGCAYVDHLQAVHIRVDSLEGLTALNGSKYVQSNTVDTYRKAQEDLKAGRFVLYSGTPCQIAGLKRFLGISYENLVTADIICHGVPSQAYFDKFVEYYEETTGTELTNFDFRSKDNKGWSIAGISVGLSNGKSVRKKQYYYSNYYYFNFLAGDIYRDSCYHCEYANLNRVGDFTLGDFWGAEGCNLPFAVKNGCSLVLLNSAKAVEIMKEMRVQVEEIPVDIAVRGNEQLQKPSTKREQRDMMLQEFRECSGAELQKRFRKRNRMAILKGKLKYAVPQFLRNLVLKVRHRHK